MQIYIFNAFKNLQTAAHQWIAMFYYCSKGSGKQMAHLLINKKLIFITTFLCFLDFIIILM